MRTLSRHALAPSEIVCLLAVVATLVATLLPLLGRSPDHGPQQSLDLRLHTLRLRLQRYADDHGGAFPEIHDGTLLQLTHPTRQDGSLDPRGPLGPYLSVEMLENPVSSSATFAPPDAVVGDAPLGWVYDAESGRVWPSFLSCGR